MIGLSRFRRHAGAPVALAALLVVVSASVASCELLGGSCNAPSCGDMSSLVFEGSYSYGRGAFDGPTADGGAPADAIQIDIAMEKNQTFVTLQTCWLTHAATRQLVCGAPSQLYLNDGSGLQVDVNARTLRVTMSENGNQLSQETVSPATTTYSCGCGDVTSTIRTFHIQLPPP
jgi:hypothetical protein